MNTKPIQPSGRSLRLINSTRGRMDGEMNGKTSITKQYHYIVLEQVLLTVASRYSC
jgi:hypothetical protein